MLELIDTMAKNKEMAEIEEQTEQTRAEAKKPLHFLYVILNIIRHGETCELVKACILMIKNDKDALRKLLSQYDPIYADAINYHKKKKQIGNSVADKQLILIEQLLDQNKGAVLFLSPYFAPEKLADGYFQRVKAVDELVPANVLRIYVSWLNLLDGEIPRIKIWDETHIEISYPQKDPYWNLRIHDLAKKTKVTYYQSVTFANHAITEDPNIYKIIDLHGAYPEEERMYDKGIQADYDEEQEKDIINTANKIVCVSNGMITHISNKYPKHTGKYILMPIYSMPLDRIPAIAKKNSSELIVVYSGGFQKWQCIDDVKIAIKRGKAKCRYEIYSKEIAYIEKSWEWRRLKEKVSFMSLNKEELFERLEKAHYGFVLRENNIVNQVACPTKLIEYIEHGVVPICNNSPIGDFMKLGMSYVPFQDFLEGKLPDENGRLKMAKNNLQVLLKLSAISEKGKEVIGALFERG